VTRHPRVRRDAAVGALGLALVVAGCAAHVPPPAAPSVAVGDEAAKALVERWAAEWQTFTGLRAAVDLTVRAPKREDRASALLLVSPSALRLEITTPLGFPALVATAGPDRIVVFRPFERRAMTGAPTPEAVQHWLGVPVDPAALVGLLVGYVPAPDPGTLRTEGGTDPHLVYAHRGVRHRVWVTAAGFPARLLVDEKPGFSATYDWTVDGHVQRLQVDVPDREVHLTLRYVSVEAASPPPEAFVLTLPPDIKTDRLD
jgi:hypothetical protein